MGSEVYNSGESEELLQSLILKYQNLQNTLLQLRHLDEVSKIIQEEGDEETCTCKACTENAEAAK